MCRSSSLSEQCSLARPDGAPGRGLGVERAGHVGGEVLEVADEVVGAGDVEVAEDDGGPSTDTHPAGTTPSRPRSWRTRASRRARDRAVAAPGPPSARSAFGRGSFWAGRCDVGRTRISDAPETFFMPLRYVAAVTLRRVGSGQPGDGEGQRGRGDDGAGIDEGQAFHLGTDRVHLGIDRIRLGQ